MTYNPHADARACYDLACYMLALRQGSRRPQTLFEWYFVESYGGIP